MDLSQKTLGAKIAALRKIRNMTQEQLAAQLGISAPAVSKWETGSSYPDITLLAPLARALGTNLDMIRYFTSSQVAIARETRNILCADLSQNHTARELAERFQVPKPVSRITSAVCLEKISPHFCERQGCAGQQNCCRAANYE